MGTQARRERRKERNRAASKALTRSLRMNRLKQLGIMAAIAVAIIGAVTLAVINIDNTNHGVITTHGG